MGTLIVIATPIGNLEDITYRAVRTLGELDALACEDTRMTRKIFDRYDIPRPKNIFSYHEHNEARAGKGILKLLDDDKTVGLTSDGGYPGISDPGYRIISEAIEAGHEIDVLPGASAPPVALLLSGLPSSSHTIKGFPPKKPGQRIRFLEAERDLPHTLIFFESPHRIEKLVRDCLKVYGNRRAAVCFELTKKFQRVHRGFLDSLLENLENQESKGEITLVVVGNNPKFSR